MADLQSQIEQLWERRDEVTADDFPVVKEAIDLLDSGEARVAELGADGEPVVHQWLKQAILLLFRLSEMQTIELGPFEFADRIPLKRGYAAAGVRAVPGASARRGAFLERGEDFVVRDTLPELVAGMNALTPHAPLDPAEVERLVVARDREVLNPFTKDLQIAALRGARRYRGDRLIRVAPPHRLLDPSAGPLVAVRLRVLTRKTLGGLETDLSARRPWSTPGPRWARALRSAPGSTSRVAWVSAASWSRPRPRP